MKRYVDEDSFFRRNFLSVIFTAMIKNRNAVKTLFLSFLDKTIGRGRESFSKISSSTLLVIFVFNFIFHLHVHSMLLTHRCLKSSEKKKG